MLPNSAWFSKAEPDDPRVRWLGIVPRRLNLTTRPPNRVHIPGPSAPRPAGVTWLPLQAGAAGHTGIALEPIDAKTLANPWLFEESTNRGSVHLEGVLADAASQVNSTRDTNH